MWVVVNVCNNEQVALATSDATHFLTYEVGSTVNIPDWKTMVSGFFVSTPHNSHRARCNNIDTEAYSDVGLTTVLTTGNAIVPNSLNLATWD